jgi:FkbM family methyltransferase
MLIKTEDVKALLESRKITVEGVFHIGAHDCEELWFYHTLGVQNIVWVDAVHMKVYEARKRGIPNVYHALITDADDQSVVFNVSNNIQSSSVLELGTHKTEHPSVFFTNQISMKSVTVDTFLERNNIDPSKLTFWNFDIQGAELLALKGATKALQYAKILYLEVNEKELYKDCALIGDIDAYLLPFGFVRVLTDMTNHGWGDAIYVR